MPEYRFQLEPIRKLRSAHRDQQRVRLAEALAAQHQLETRLQSIDGELAGLKAVRRNAVAGATFDVNTLLDSGRYEVVLQAQRDAMDGQRTAIEAEADRRRGVLAEAEQQVRVLDKLDDRRRGEFNLAASRRDAAQLDEVATQQYLRRQIFS